MKERIRAALVEVLEGMGMFEEDFVLELGLPRDPSHGDLSTNVALVLSKRLDRKPRELAGEIAASLELDKELVSSVEIAGPGFINFRYGPRSWAVALGAILEAGDDFGRSEDGEGQKVNVEFISANPTGPFNIVSARAAAVGAALVRCMERAGYRAHAEFYCNDAGRQVLLLGQSLRARYAELAGIDGVEFPEEGYRGEYLVDMARELLEGGSEPPRPSGDDGAGRIQGRLPQVEGDPAAWMELDDEASAAAFGRYALLRNIEQQRRTCRRYGLSFDTWFLESDLHANDRLDETLEQLKAGEHVYEHEGATWFRSTDFGDEKDRVLVKADGVPTYFLADIAYHASKHRRGFEHAIDFFGPDHHGHIARLDGAMQALGYGEGWLEVLILQQVNLILDGKPLEMSKRAGRLITMDELIDEVGADAAKFFFLDRKNNSHLDFDLDLAKSESKDNPVFYVKYAHARICSVLRNAKARDIDPEELAEDDLLRLSEPAEMELVRLLPELPRTIASAARSREMSRLTNFSREVAAAFHHFYQHCPVLGDDPELTRARLGLCRATLQVLANTLALIGVDAPERM